MKDNLESRIIGAALDRTRPGWRKRAEVQRSWWKFFESYLVIILTIVFWLLAVTFVSGKIHTNFHPNDAEAIPNPLRAAISIWTLSIIGPIQWPICCFSGILVNSVENFFQFTRTRAERGSDLYSELTINNSNRGLMKAAIWGSLITIPLFIFGSVGPWVATHHH